MSTAAIKGSKRCSQTVRRLAENTPHEEIRMNTNVIELRVVLTAWISGTAALQAFLLRRSRRRSFRLGIHLMPPYR